MERTYLILGASALGMAVGFGAGYSYAKKRLTEQYDLLLEEQMAATKKHYAKTYKAEDFATPTSAAEHLLGDAVEALTVYRGKQEVIEDPVVEDVDLPDEEVVAEEKNVFDDNGDEQRLDKAHRDPDRPYVVDMDEYMENPSEHDQLTFTYYAGDHVLADERDKEVPDVDGVVGNMNLNMFGIGTGGDPNVVMIRNERLGLDFEIALSQGKYTVEVLGFDDNELKHSDERMRKSRPRWDE